MLHPCEHANHSPKPAPSAAIAQSTCDRHANYLHQEKRQVHSPNPAAVRLTMVTASIQLCDCHSPRCAPRRHLRPPTAIGSHLLHAFVSSTTSVPSDTSNFIHHNPCIWLLGYARQQPDQHNVDPLSTARDLRRSGPRPHGLQSPPYGLRMQGIAMFFICKSA